MTINSPNNDKLAALGGTPVFSTRPSMPWPPTDEETRRAVAEAYSSGIWSWTGPWEKKSCAKLAEVHSARHALLMVNGTVTLEAALHVLGVGPGDEVIVPALTWIATAMAVVYVGAKPVFVDVEPDTLCLDPELVAEAITPRTKAIIPVHLYGGMANMDRLMALAHKHGLKVIEDCAHAQGGEWDGRGLGSIGDVGSFSFQQSKTVSAGEGGGVITNDDELAERLFRFKHIGYSSSGVQGKAASGPPEGLVCHNYRATEFQGAVLYNQLCRLPTLTEARNRNADFLTNLLEQIPGVRVQARGLKATPGRQSYYNFMVLIDSEFWMGATRDQILPALAREGVPVNPTYGTVHRHVLWNLPASEYRIHGEYRDKLGQSCKISEEIGTARAIGFLHFYLDLPLPDLARIAEAFVKVHRNAPDLGKVRW